MKCKGKVLLLFFKEWSAPAETKAVKIAGGYSHVKTYEDMLQFWVSFLQEIPNHGSHFS